MAKKILIIGYARSGKDTVAEYFKINFGLNYASSSLAAAKIFIFEALSEKYGYKSFKECFEDRVNHRKEWFDLITSYNKNDKSRLAKAILKQNDCYVGMRCMKELKSCIDQSVFDLIIWVDGEKRVGVEDKSSCTISKKYADIVIENNNSLSDLETKLNRIGNALF